jgi:predicted nucleic acid-binding protein
MIVLDTSVLSLAFRRRIRGSEVPAVALRLTDLITRDVPLAIPGIVLQELLSGVRAAAQFARLQILLEGFPTSLATRATHLLAAELANRCRRGGVATSAADCLIAAHAIEQDGELFTTDGDFVAMAAKCTLRLFGP